MNQHEPLLHTTKKITASSAPIVSFLEELNKEFSDFFVLVVYKFNKFRKKIAAINFAAMLTLNFWNRVREKLYNTLFGGPVKIVNTIALILTVAAMIFSAVFPIPFLAVTIFYLTLSLATNIFRGIYWTYKLATAVNPSAFKQASNTIRIASVPLLLAFAVGLFFVPHIGFTIASLTFSLFLAFIVIPQLKKYCIKQQQQLEAFNKEMGNILDSQVLSPGSVKATPVATPLEPTPPKVKSLKDMLGSGPWSREKIAEALNWSQPNLVSKNTPDSTPVSTAGPAPEAHGFAALSANASHTFDSFFKRAFATQEIVKEREQGFTSSQAHLSFITREEESDPKTQAQELEEELTDTGAATLSIGFAVISGLTK